jgi:intracellular sulfur oxidation DsrE/DsrF family protein
VNHSKFRAERILHAYVDGELSTSEKQRMLLRLETDERSRKRICDLQRTKEWVQFSFEGERAPTRHLPDSRHRVWSQGVIRVAASFALLALAFGAGWIGRTVQQPAQLQASLDSIVPQAQHLILHIGVSDEAQFNAVLQKARQVLDDYSAQGVQVEVVTNAGGLDLVRTASSHYQDSIRQLIDNYDNVRFIACSKGLQRLREQGQDVHLIKGVTADEPAADHLIQRLTEGWTLIKI